MKTVSITFLKWLMRKYPNNSDLGRELRRRIENDDFSMGEN